MEIANAHTTIKPNILVIDFSQKISNNNHSQHITLGLLEMHGVQDMFLFVTSIFYHLLYQKKSLDILYCLECL
jgi:hypothetical protein